MVAEDVDSLEEEGFALDGGRDDASGAVGGEVTEGEDSLAGRIQVLVQVGHHRYDLRKANSLSMKCVLKLV